MILSGALLFLYGTLVSASPFVPSIPTEIVISKHKHGSSDKIKILPSSSHSSIIENYIQEGTNVFFKPQFVLSADKMPPQVQSLIAAVENDDCIREPLVTPVVVDEPLRVVEQDISGPISKIEQITEIKPAGGISSLLQLHSRPEFLTMIEEGKPPKILPDNFFLEIEEPKEPVVIPPAPVLPPIELPELPILEEEELIAEIACEHHVPITTVVEVEKPREVEVVVDAPEVHIPVLATMVEDKNEYEVPLMIPPGPVLPPFERPNFEVMVEGSLLPYEHNPVEPVIVEVEETKEIKVIPPGPVLPPIEMPKLPVMVESVPLDVELPCEPHIPPFVVEVEKPNIVIEETEVATNEMLNIPPAPVLAPLEMPHLPIVVEEKHNIESGIIDIPCPPEQPIATIHEIHQPMYIEQNRFFVPSRMAHFETSKLPIEIPSVPHYIMSSIPNFDQNKHCVDDIVIERVLPKMRKDIIYERPVPYLVPVL